VAKYRSLMPSLALITSRAVRMTASALSLPSARL
jgi:hypothetical protein